MFNTIIKVQRGFALYNKGNHQQNEKATYQMRENISKSNVWYGNTIQNMWRTQTTQKQKSQSD